MGDCPMHDRQNENKNQRIINIMRDKRTCRMHSLSSVRFCPDIHWFLPREKPSPHVLTGGDMWEKVSYADS